MDTLERARSLKATGAVKQLLAKEPKVFDVITKKLLEIETLEEYYDWLEALLKEKGIEVTRNE